MALDAQLYLALHTATRAMNSGYRPLLAPFGLTHTQYQVMLVLWERHSLTVGELGARLQLSSGTLSPLLARLEHEGLISRRRRADDVRLVEVRSTRKGQRMRGEVSRVSAVVGEASALTPAEIADLRDILQVLTMRVGVAELHRKAPQVERSTASTPVY